MYRILQDDALDHHWIDLYNSTIHKNKYLFYKLYVEKKEDDYTRIYNYFVENQLTFVRPVSFISFISKLKIFHL